MSKATDKTLSMYAGIEDKEQYEIVDHTGKVQRMNGMDLKTYITAHRKFITIEQPVKKIKLPNEN